MVLLDIIPYVGAKIIFGIFGDVFRKHIAFHMPIVDFSSADSVDPSQHFIEKMPRSKGPMLTDCKARDDL